MTELTKAAEDPPSTSSEERDARPPGPIVPGPSQSASTTTIETGPPSYDADAEADDGGLTLTGPSEESSGAGGGSGVGMASPVTIKHFSIAITTCRAMGVFSAHKEGGPRRGCISERHKVRHRMIGDGSPSSQRHKVRTTRLVQVFVLSPRLQDDLAESLERPGCVGEAPEVSLEPVNRLRGEGRSCLQGRRA